MTESILIVDDSVSMREVIKMGLTGAGYDVIAGVNGEDGLRLLAENENIKLVITDLNMPVMDGITFLKEIRKKDSCRFLPVIVLTTESQEEKRMEAKQAGATGWITKPFVNERLIATVKKIYR